jgi:hypothetical protein
MRVCLSVVVATEEKEAEKIRVRTGTPLCFWNARSFCSSITPAQGAQPWEESSAVSAARAEPFAQKFAELCVCAP